MVGRSQWAGPHNHNQHGCHRSLQLCWPYLLIHSFWPQEPHCPYHISDGSEIRARKRDGSDSDYGHGGQRNLIQLYDKVSDICINLFNLIRERLALLFFWGLGILEEEKSIKQYE